MCNKVVFGLAIMVLVAGFSAQASAHETFSLQQTAWISQTTAKDGSTSTNGMVFMPDGTFVFMVEQNGKLDKTKGTYQIQGDTLYLQVDGKNLEMTLVSLTSERLVTEGRGGMMVKWSRFRN